MSMLSVTGSSVARQLPRCLRTVYRVFEVACTAVGLAMLTPLFLVMAGMILCDEGRPMFSISGELDGEAGFSACGSFGQCASAVVEQL